MAQNNAINLAKGLIATSGINSNITKMTGINSTIQSPTAIADSLGNNILGFNYVANPINYLQISNASATRPTIAAVGTGTNINIQLANKGAGAVVISSPTGTTCLALNPLSGAFNANFVTSLTATRSYTFQDATGTVAFLSDITAINNYTIVSSTSQAIVQNTKYVANNASLVIFTLPSTFSVGDSFEVVGQGSGGWKIQQSTASQIIHFQSTDSTLGITGTMFSNQRYNSVRLVCTVANNEFVVSSFTGSPSVS